jgi:hypothetical protein
MKKVVAFVFAVSLMVALFSSCRSHETCPAYHNGSADVAAPLDHNNG